MKRLKIILFVFLFALLWLPLFQELTRFFKEPGLNGAFVKPDKPKFSKDSLKIMAFQKKWEDYENHNFGFRGFFVKTRNSLNYLLFNELSIKDNVAGKNGFIFQTESTEQTLGLTYGPKEKYENVLEKIKFLKQGLEKYRVHFLAVMAPSKEKILPDYLPLPYFGKYKTPNEYNDFISGYKRLNIPFIDFSPYFKAMRDTCRYDLFTKTGYHWSMYGAAFAQDSLLRYIESSLGKPIPSYKRTGVEISDTARDSDADFEGPLNLFFSLQQKRYAHPKFEMIPATKKNYRPKVIVIGDSFFWQVKNQGMLKHIFSDDSKFWFYFADTSYPINDSTSSILRKEDEVMEELEDADYVILFCNISTLDYFPYGVEKFYYDHQNQATIIKSLIEYFRKDDLQSRNLHLEAKSENLSIDEWTLTRAKYIRKNRKIVSLIAANHKYVCADEVNEGRVVSDRDTPFLWETFSMLHLSENKIVLYSHNKKFVSAAENNKEGICSNAKEIGFSEIFTLVKIDKRYIALKAANGRFLSLNKTTKRIYATAESIGVNEMFELKNN
jgi:hypothetical protein